MKGTTLLMTSILAVALAACASSRSGSAYTRDQARQEMTVRLGVVDSVRPVTIEGAKSEVGPLAGAALGGLGGSKIGKGRGSAAGAVLGAVAGGVAGAMIEDSLTRKPGQEITVKLESGQLIAIVQEADEAFRPGEHVRVLNGGGATRVTH